MCGLAGLVALDRIGEPARLADAIDTCLAHRGPDDRDRHYSADGTALLVHRRLSIIDLSAAGRQPMSSRDGRHWLVYNGEIYNHAALRCQLSTQGVTFRTASDTEVLLEWILRYGADGLVSVRGMFALALWDERERTLVVARDRFGMKPLYVHWFPDRVAFASEVGVLVRSGLVARRIDPAGVLSYLSWGSIPPPLTWVCDVEAVPPGTWRRWSAGGSMTAGTFADVRRSWLDDGGAEATSSADDLRARTADALADSLRAHLVADVPVGVFLSGGIDSGAIVSLARGLQRDLHTYTVSVDDSATDEAPLAARVAEHFGTTHHALAVESRTVIRDWPSILAHLDQPTGDAINSYCVSRVVRESGVKCVLSGVGGDEAFGGYPSFRRIPRARALARLPRRVMATMAAGAALVAPARASRVRQIAGSEGDIAGIYRGLRGLLMPDEIDSFVGPLLKASPEAWRRAAAVDQRNTEALGPETDAGTVARLESCVYMRAQLLRDIDAMSMAHGLEVRMPFVDHELVASVWPALGRHPHLLRHKRLLTSALSSPLPPEVTDGPKRGFTLPFSQWMAGPLSEMVRSGMSDLAADGWIAADAPDRVWTTWRAGRVHWSRPWALGVLGRFLRDG